MIIDHIILEAHLSRKRQTGVTLVHNIEDPEIILVKLDVVGVRVINILLLLAISPSPSSSSSSSVA